MNSELGEATPEIEDDDFGDSDDEFGDSDDDSFADTVVLPEADETDNVGDASVEINVEQLIADIEGANDESSARKKEIRRRLEEMAEEKSFEDTYAIDFD